MPQLLLFPDPRPLVEKLGPEFFRSAPESPGVYLMRGASAVLYVGKAKNLRKRLASYRVANPDRMPRRHLRLLRAVEQIELQPCADEAAALARESTLLLTLRPKFNRAGTWPGTPRFLAWRITHHGLALAVTQQPEPDWCHFGPMGLTAVHLRAALARLIWCALFPEIGIAGLPEGWFYGRHEERCTVQVKDQTQPNLAKAAECLGNLFTGRIADFSEWIHTRTVSWKHPFDLAVREADLETLGHFAIRVSCSASASRLARLPSQT
jgi:hypothetical protein